MSAHLGPSVTLLQEPETPIWAKRGMTRYHKRVLSDHAGQSLDPPGILILATSYWHGGALLSLTTRGEQSGGVACSRWR